MADNEFIETGITSDTEFIEKLRTLHIVRPGRRGSKTTTDRHDHHTVDVTEHWNDRVDVNVKLETLQAGERKR